MNLVMFLIVGLIAGWVATELTSANHKSFIFGNVVIGILGALVGGYVFEILGITMFSFWESVGTSMVGATIVLSIVKFLTGRKDNRQIGN